jgi:hypothetical protein
MTSPLNLPTKDLRDVAKKSKFFGNLKGTSITKSRHKKREKLSKTEISENFPGNNNPN